LADGSEIWNAQCSGTPSRISTGDGVLFVVGGGDGILYAYDQENGGVLWTMKSTELPKADKQGWFQRTFLFVEQQNRLMVTDGRNWWGLSFSNGVFTQ
jgi:outer membrane protein assembly factor BamB